MLVCYIFGINSIVLSGSSISFIISILYRKYYRQHFFLSSIATSITQPSQPNYARNTDGWFAYFDWLFSGKIN